MLLQQQQPSTSVTAPLLGSKPLLALLQTRGGEEERGEPFCTLAATTVVVVVVKEEVTLKLCIVAAAAAVAAGVLLLLLGVAAVRCIYSHVHTRRTGLHTHTETSALLSAHHRRRRCCRSRTERRRSTDSKGRCSPLYLTSIRDKARQMSDIGGKGGRGAFAERDATLGPPPSLLKLNLILKPSRRKTRDALSREGP